MKRNFDEGCYNERGQATIFVVLAMAIFLLAFVALAIDYTNGWSHRQKAQTAADATCQAGAMDLLLYAQQAQTAKMNFVPALGASIDCAASLTAAPCIIAKKNGYDAAVASNRVTLSFPSSVSGRSGPSGVSVSFITVDITEQVPLYFSQLLTARSSLAAHAKASCGVTAPVGPVPIVVLHPSDPTAINMSGAQNAIKIIGGGQRSIQVNSTSLNAVTAGSLETVDLSGAGPNNTGGSFGVFGGVATKPDSVNLGTSGSWDYPATPVSDPYRSVSAPASPTVTGTVYRAKKGTACSTPALGCYRYHGCPDANGCDEYTPGNYGSQISVKNKTAIFEPGLYNIVGGLSLESNSIVRVTCCGDTADGDGSGGVMFYFSGTGTLNVDSNSGKSGLADVYYRDGGTHNGVQSRALQCPGGAPNPAQIPPTIDGNMLVAPCTGPYSDPSGQYRGFLFFQDRSVAALPSWQGGGSTLTAGFMYFHQCRPDGAGLTCSAPRSGGYGTIFNLGGNPGSASYAVGSIVTDKIAMNGNAAITMILSPSASFSLLKVALLE